MHRHVAFMRAINVAGHARVRMSDVRDAFAAAGCRKVRTYIQSGNVIFESPPREAAAILRRVQPTLRHALDEEPEIVGLEAIAMRGQEVFVVSRPKKDGFFGFPNSFIEKEFGISATTRNWSTVTRIAELAQTEADG